LWCAVLRTKVPGFPIYDGAPHVRPYCSRACAIRPIAMADGSDERIDALEKMLQELKANGPAQAASGTDERLEAIEQAMTDLKSDMRNTEDAPAPPSPPPTPPPPPPSGAASELSKAEATLEGLKVDGYGPEVLTPLEGKIATLRERVGVESALPPLSASQRKIWEACDKINDEAQQTDSDSAARLNVLRGERKFLLDALLRSDQWAYVYMLDVLAARDIPAEDYPCRQGIAMVSADAVEEGLAAEAEAATTLRTVKDAELALAAEAQLAAAGAEAANEASAAAGDPSDIDLTFARCFLASEEERFNVRPRVVGRGMWTPELDAARLKTFRAFLVRLLEGKELQVAVAALARDDLLVAKLKDESKEAAQRAASCREAARLGDAADAAADDDDDANVGLRLECAWAARADFVARWQGRVDSFVAPAEPSYEGLSAVGRLRAQQAWQREASGAAPDDTADKLNKWFGNFLK